MSDPIISILAALQTKFDASVLAEDVAGLWAFQAPQAAVMPYITVLPLGSTPSATFTEDFEETRIQFSIWYGDQTDEETTILAEVSALYSALTVLFDECTLTITGYTLIRMNRESCNLVRDPDGGWQYQVDYRLQLQET